MVAQQKMKEEEVTEVGADASVAPSGGAKQPGSPKSRLAMLKRSTAKKAAATAAATDPFRFQGNGVTYKAKLIGVRDVEAARGDTMCADAMRDAKASVKAAGAHKTRIQLSINIDGIKIQDEKATMVLHTFPVSRISFIARDTTDARAFGFVFGEADGKYKFYGIKTAQTADHAVLAIRDMFQIVYEMKRKQVEQMKAEKEDQNKKEMEENGIRSENGVLVADLLDLETELQNIGWGVDQLAHIPVVAGDEWPGENQQQQAHSQSFPSAAAPAANDSLGGLMDAFGQTAFSAAATPRSQPDPFGNSFLSSASSFGATPQFGASPALAGHGMYGMHSVHSTPSQQPQQWGVSPMMQQQQAAAAAPQQHLQHHHAYATSTPNFADTNPFASPMAASSFYTSPMQQPQPHFAAAPAAAAAADPFDTSAFKSNGGGAVNWNLGNENTAPLQQQQPAATGMTHANSFTAAFSDQRSTPTIPPTSTTPTHQWEQAGSRKVSSLEEAFTKLVDMDSLVSQPTMKKNPFDHLINPPKVPLNSLSHGMASAPCGVSAASVPQAAFGGAAKANDPFADDFFN